MSDFDVLTLNFACKLSAANIYGDEAWTGRYKPRAVNTFAENEWDDLAH
jgi:hypothetical protein